MKIRTDDNVIVISGKDKGKTGKVIRVDRKRGRVFVEGLNIVKRHQRANPARANAPVGVIEREGGIHVSNVAILDPKDNKPTRVALCVVGSTIATLEMWIGPSRSITPTCRLGRPGTGRWWRLIMFRPSTKTRSRSGSTRMTLPVFPLSLPEITTTLSSLRILAMSRAPPGRARRSS